MASKQSVLASGLQKKMDQEFSADQINYESGELQDNHDSGDQQNRGQQSPVDGSGNNYDSLYDDNEIKIFDDQQRDRSQAYGTDEEEALLNQYQEEGFGSPTKSNKEVRDSRNSGGSKKLITPKKGKYIKNAFENNAVGRIPGDRKNYQLKGNQVTRLEKLNNKFVNNVAQPKENRSVKKMRGAEDVDSQHIERLQNWYQNRVSPQPAEENQDSQLAPATNLDYRNMLAHYQQHMNNLKDQQEFLKHLSSSDQVEFKVPNNLAKKIQRSNIVPRQNMGSGGVNNSNLPSIGGPQINVHQHFNQPNITNFNHNAYYVSDTKSSQEPFMYRKPSMGTDKEENRQGAKSHGGPTGVKRAGQRRLVPQQKKSDEESLKKLKNRHTQQNAKSWGQEEQPSSARKGSSQVALQGIKEISPFDEGSAGGGNANQEVMSIHGASLEDGVTDANLRHAEGLQGSTSIDQAIYAQANFFNQRQLAQKALKRAAGPGLIPLTILPSGINRNQGPPLSFKNLGSLDRAAYASQRSQIRFSPTHNPYAIQQNGKRRIQPDHKKFSLGEGMAREDMYDQLLLVKSQLNNANDELTKTKTRNAILQQQLKEKDKFIDELLKSTYLMNQALVSNNEQLAAQQKGPTSPNKSGADEPAQAYQQFLEKGPYSVLKLKKKVADLKELLLNKTQENEELVRNIKQRKIVELQKEIVLYSRECQKLRDFTFQTIDVIRRNGLEAELDQYPAAKALSKIRGSSGAESNSQRSTPRVDGELPPMKENGLSQEPEAGEQDKLQTLKRKVQKLEREKTQLVNSDKKKNEQLKSLQEKLQSLQAKTDLHAVYADKSLKGTSTHARVQSRTSIEGPNKVEGSKDVAEDQSNLKQRLAQLEQEKAITEKNLNQEKSINQLMSRKIESLETQAKQSKHGDQSKQQEQSNVKLQKAKEEKSQLQKQIDRSAIEIKTLKKQVETQKIQEVKQSKTGNKGENDTVAQLGKGLEAAKKVQEEQKKQIAIQKNQVSEKEHRIFELEKLLKKSETEKAFQSQPQVTRKTTQAPQTKKVTGLAANSKAAQSSKQRSQTTKAQEGKVGGLKKNQPRADNEGEENMTQSSFVNSQLEHERNMIEQKIKNVKESDLDERSEFQFSQMQSMVPGVTASEISGISNQKQQAPFVAYQLHNDTIKEDIENEEHDQTRHFKGSKQNAGPKGAVNEENSKGAADSQRQKKNGKDFLTVGKQSVSVSEVVAPRKITVGQKGDNQLIDQLDRIPSESKISESVQGSTIAARGSIKNLNYIEFEHASVQLGIKRLGRALQLKRLQLDQIEQVVLGNKFKSNQSITISQLAVIFQQKLALSDKEATDFARFLIEEKDEDRPDILTIDFDPNRKVNSQYIPVRLMTRFTECPIIYDIKQEQNVKSKFNKVFDQVKAKKFVKKLNEQEEAIISFTYFKQQVQQAISPNALTESDIESAFILLCRGRSDPKTLTDQELAEKVQGFDSQNMHLLFDATKQDESDEYSEDEYIDDNNFINSDKTQSINESVVQDIQKIREATIDNQMGTFRSKGQKSDDYENEFEEEIISDEDSDKRNKKGTQNRQKYYNNKYKMQQNFENEKTGNFGDQDLIEGKQSADKTLQQNKNSEPNLAQDEQKVQGEEPSKASKDSQKKIEPAIKDQQEKGAEFTFKQEASIDSKRSLKQDRYNLEDDRSENEFDQQDSMNPEQLDGFKFGGTDKDIDIKYEQDEKQIIREQSREHLVSVEEHQEQPEEGQDINLPQDNEQPVIASETVKEEQAATVSKPEAIVNQNMDLADVTEPEPAKNPSLAEPEQPKQQPEGQNSTRVAQANEADAYEYYDEEDPEAAIAAQPVLQEGNDQKEKDQPVPPEGNEQNEKEQKVPQEGNDQKEKDQPVPLEGNEQNEKEQKVPQEGNDQKEKEQPVPPEDNEQKEKEQKVPQDGNDKKEIEKQEESVEAPKHQVTSSLQSQVLSDLQQEIAQKMGADGLAVLKVQGGDDAYEYYDEEDDGDQKQKDAGAKQEEKVMGKDIQQEKQAPIELDEEEPKVDEDAAKPEAQEAPEEQKIKLEKLPEQPQAGPVTFTSEQIALLNEELFQILNRKMKQENLYNDIDQTHVNQLLSSGSALFQQIGASVLNNFAELADSCRDIFREIIYSEVSAAGKYSTKTSNNSLNINVKTEVELLKLDEFVFKVEELLQPTKLTPQQQSCLQILLTFKQHGGHLLYTDIAAIMRPLGIQDFKVPKGQASSTQLNYDGLDLRSVRLINRMIHYLGSCQVSFSDFMKDIVELQAVKTKTGSKDAEIFLAKKFFQKLYDQGIKKNNLLHPNLCIFLCIDQKYKNYLMLKKLKRMIIDFNQSMYFQSVGLKKQKLVEPAEAFEYYDEEDQAHSVKNMSQPPQSVVNDIAGMSSQRNESGAKMMIPDPNQVGQHAANNANNAAGYEYYDEEDPTALEEASAKIEAQSKQVETVRAQALQHANAHPLPTETEGVHSQPNNDPTVVEAAKEEGKIPAVTAAAAQPLATPAQADAQYEYYDEEDDGK